MVVPEEDIISAIFSSILIVIYIIIGLHISLKYFKVKQRFFPYMGMAWVVLSMAWWSSAINVFLLLINPSTGGLSGIWYYIIAIGFLPIGLFLYVSAISDIQFPQKRKYFQLLFFLFGIVYEVLSFYFIFRDPSVLIVKEGLFVEYGLLTISFIILLLIGWEIFGFLLTFGSLKSQEPVLKLKGKLLFIAFILFPIGSLLDSLTKPPLLDFLDRVILIFAVVFFYFGFVMPNWMKNRILKQE